MKTNLWILIGFLAVGCQRKDENGKPVGHMPLPAACQTLLTTYTGTFTPGANTESVPINADLIDHPGEVAGDSTTPSRLVNGASIDIEICGPTVGCRDGIPSQYVWLDHNKILFQFMASAGYASYTIHTLVCQ